MNIAVVGLSHKTAPVEIREKLSISEDQIEQAIARLRNYPHICEVVILSTCNRMEIYVSLISAEHTIQEVIEFLSEHSQLSIDELKQHLFILLQQDAAIHLMQVSSGLDSLVVGEGQILAQVKRAYQLAQDYKGIRRILHQLFKQAITVAKRVRTETSIGTGAISISAAAVELAQVKVKDLSTYRIGILGAGKMARLLVKHMLSKGATQISIINRSIERAQELAERAQELTTQVKIQCYPLSEMIAVVMNCDLVFTSTASTEPLLNRAKLETFINLNQPLMLFDISVPRNVDADVNELANVQVFNVDDLKTVVAQNQKGRQQAAIQAQRLIEEEVQAFETWFRSLETFSTISCLWEKVETIRERELAKTLSGLGNEVPKKHQQAIEALTRGIVNKILHEPMVQLREQRNFETQLLALQILQMLFNLNTERQDYLLSESTSSLDSKVY